MWPGIRISGSPEPCRLGGARDRRGLGEYAGGDRGLTIYRTAGRCDLNGAISASWRRCRLPDIMIRRQGSDMRSKKMVMLFALLSLAAATAAETPLPFPQALLEGEHRRPVREVVEDFTVHRQVGGLRLMGKRAVFAYLMTHPDMAASLARAAGALKFTVERRGEVAYWANDHRGLTGTLEILRATDGQMVLYAKGIYRKGIFRIPGRLALVMQSEEGREANAFYVENTLSGYVRIDAPVLDPVARLFRPFVRRIMEKRARWFFRKANRLMTRLYEDPEALLQKLPPDTWQEEANRLRSLLAAS